MASRASAPPPFTPRLHPSNPTLISDTLPPPTPLSLNTLSFHPPKDSASSTPHSYFSSLTTSTSPKSKSRGARLTFTSSPKKSTKAPSARVIPPKRRKRDTIFRKGFRFGLPGTTTAGLEMDDDTDADEGYVEERSNPRQRSVTPSVSPRTSIVTKRKGSDGESDVDSTFITAPTTPTQSQAPTSVHRSSHVSSSPSSSQSSSGKKFPIPAPLGFPFGKRTAPASLRGRDLGSASEHVPLSPGLNSPLPPPSWQQQQQQQALQLPSPFPFAAHSTAEDRLRQEKMKQLKETYAGSQARLFPHPGRLVEYGMPTPTEAFLGSLAGIKDVVEANADVDADAEADADEEILAEAKGLRREVPANGEEKKTAMRKTWRYIFDNDNGIDAEQEDANKQTTRLQLLPHTHHRQQRQKQQCLTPAAYLSAPTAASDTTTKPPHTRLSSSTTTNSHYRSSSNTSRSSSSSTSSTSSLTTCIAAIRASFEYRSSAEYQRAHCGYKIFADEVERGWFLGEKEGCLDSSYGGAKA